MEKWILKNKCANYEELAALMNINPIIAKIATNRGMIAPESIEAYINPQKSDMHNPLLLEGMANAIEIARKYIEKGDKISIVGDYDVDGIMSTTILSKGLKKFTSNIDTYIPDRIVDGYGINEDIVDTLYISGTKLIITCDNGVSAFDAIEKAKELGMAVIVLDHHEFKSSKNETGESITEYVKADAIVNPQNPLCNYPFKKICGAVVCYKFIESLHLASKEYFDYEEFIVYGAFATVCDVVDLIDENRIILKEGLNILNKKKPLGIESLCKVVGIEEKILSAYDFGYILGPCMNASGRLEHANLALELMMTNESSRAELLATTLVNLNQERKKLTEKGIKLALDSLSSLNEGPIKVIYLEAVHESIAGIIAGRMKEKLYTPFIVLTNSSEGFLKGSGRSVESINIIDEINKCKDILRSFGGHPMAAGLSLYPEELENFKMLVNKDIVDFKPIKEVAVDMILSFDKINLELYKLLISLEPYGKHNEKPSFAQTKVEIENYKIIGKEGQFLKLRVKDKTGTSIEALYFGEKQEKLLNLAKCCEKSLVDLVFEISANEYKGNITLQIIIQEFREAL